MKRILTFTAIFIFTAASAHAGLVETFGIGAKETAQGKAVAAQADTPFAVYYNPAGLTQLEGPTFSAGATVYDATVSSDNFRLKENNTVINQGWDTDNETDNDPLVNPAMGYSMPISEKLSIGVAAYAPYGLHLESNKNPYENPVSFYAWESMYTRTVVSPTIAYKLNDKISLGFGISLGQSESNAGKTYPNNFFKGMTVNELGKENMIAARANKYTKLGDDIETATDKAKADFQQALTVDETKKDGSYLNKLELESKDDFNYSWNLGVMYKPSDKLSLGLTYRSRTNADFEGDLIWRGSNIGTVEMDYDHPEQIQGGVRYAFSEKFSIEFDMTWTKWNINSKQDEPFTITDKETAIADGDGDFRAMVKETIMGGLIKKGVSTSDAEAMAEAKIKEEVTDVLHHDRDWKNTIQYQLGAEWLVNDKLSLRGGIIYDPTPVPDHTFDQGWPDTDRTVFNIGAGYKITNQWEIDTVFQYIRSTPSRDIEGDSEELNTSYSKMFGKNLDVYMDDNKGILYGLGATVTYSF